MRSWDWSCLWLRVGFPQGGEVGLVQALEAGNEFFGEGFAGLGPEEAAGDAAVFFDGEGEGEEHFDVLLDALLG